MVKAEIQMNQASATPFGVTSQVALIAGLRWRLFRNSLRAAVSARFDLAAKFVLALLFSVFAIGSATVFFVVGRLSLSGPRFAAMLAVPLWVIFLAWQLLPILIAAFKVDFEFRELLRYPLRYSTFFLLSLAYGLFDVAPALAVIWLVSFGAGLVSANPALWPVALPLLALFGLVCLLLNRVIYSWLERWLSTRRGREIFFVVFIAVMMSFQFAGLISERLGPQAAPYLYAARALLDVLPPGITATILQNAAVLLRGAPSATITLTPFAFALPALLVLYALLLLLTLNRRLRAQYRGEDLGESAALPRARGERLTAEAVAPSVSFAARLVRDPVAVLIEKELRYMLRNPAILVNLAVPLVMVVFLGLVFSDPREKFEMLRRSPELIYPSAVAYALLVVPVLAMNAFAYDAHGVQFLIGAPVRFGEVLLAKNLSLGIVIVAEALLIWPLLALLGQPPSAASVGAGLAGVLFALPAYFTVGNVLSLMFPRPFDFGSFRQRQAGTAMLFYLLLQIVLGTVVAAVMILARWQENLWIAAGIFLALALALLPVHSAMLDYCTRLAHGRREILTQELCK
jgi:ABC-2 type transport system permease protein